jgi:drug/metabolite transporter superfamily protein YnfA
MESSEPIRASSKPLLWALVGAAILAVYGVVAALQPISEFGRVYAAYGGIFIGLSLAWGIIVDGFRPDKRDLLGAAICIVGEARAAVEALFTRLRGETVWKSERGRSMTYAPEHGKVLCDRLIR